MSLTVVTRDNFAYANGDLFVEASGHNRHRRATLDELKTHFKSGSDKDYPAHWFEAQLLHYGLKPSKTKSVARMRLFDAVNGSKLTVPAHIAKMESELKKEWTKKDREAKKAIKAGTSSEVKKMTERKPGAKRKADSSDDLTLSIAGYEITVSKKAKTASPIKAAASKDSPKPKALTKPKAAPKEKPTPKEKAAPKEKQAPKKPTPKEKPTPQALTPAKSTSATVAKKKTAPKQTARRGGTSQGPSRASASSTAAQPKPPGTKQTARRSGAFVARGRIPFPPGGVNADASGYDDPPPPYSEFDD